MNATKTTTITTSLAETLRARPPIVTVLGHVDHGKTTLLDYIRKADVAAGESGGITQHIGAYEVVVPHGPAQEGAKITFLDTPGHEAFSRMRERGATAADVAVLVVAADDGVKAQTLEAIRVIRESNVPFVVALNKIDKPEANAERAKKELAAADVLVEEWGGTVPLVPISARTGQGITQLLEMILLVSEMEELKGDAARPACGLVVESFCDPQRGNTATLIVRDGTLRRGDCVSAGGAVVRVRMLENDRGEAVPETSFSAPVRVIGFDRLPPVGAEFAVADSKAEACAQAETFLRSNGAQKAAGGRGALATVTAENVALILKADVAGSLEALEDIARDFCGKGIGVQVLRAGVGNISEDDAQIAAGKDRVFVVGFRVKFEPRAEAVFERSGIKAQCFDVIYEAREWLKARLEELLPQEETETELGSAKILKLFRQKNGEAVIGGRVHSGVLREGAIMKFLRGDAALCEGTVAELQHNKVRVAEVRAGEEFGMRVAVPCGVAQGDHMVAVERSSRKRALE